MTEEHYQEPPLYSADDHLRLLQLMTRRAISERRYQAGEESRNELDPTTAEKALKGNQAIPDCWRLIPQDISLYDWQRKCLPLWLEHGRGTVKVATGGGKTTFALAAAQELQNKRERDLRLVIVVPTIPLMFQWQDELRRGNLPGSAIALMGGGQELPPLELVRVLVCVLNSARERLPDLVHRAKWSHRMLLVVDECHRTSATQASKIFNTQPQYTLGLSATPEPDVDSGEMPSDVAYEHGVVGQALGPIIYDFTLKQSLAAGLLTPFEVWHIGLPLAPEESAEHARLSLEIADLRKNLQVRHSKSRSKQGFLAWCQTQASRGGSSAAEAERFIGLANRRKRLLYCAKSRSEITLDILSEAMIDVESRAIVFHESIEQIEKYFIGALDRGLPSVLEHSQLPDSLRSENIDAFRRGLSRVIISAKSLVEGFNVPSADLGVIAASSGSVRQRIQSLGRMLRRKAGQRTARVYVLYVRDTEDEAIYEKADWERVVGAEQNRYFVWHSKDQRASWGEGLQETNKAPRKYRPPAWEVDIAGLMPGDPYPGQSHGTEVRVDQSGNLRTEDGEMLSVPREIVKGILISNPYRRARITSSGHIITRMDVDDSADADWRFLGVIKVPLPSEALGKGIRLRLRSFSGRRVIAREEGRRTGTIAFALGPDASHTPEAGAARDRLLEWVREVESRMKCQIYDLYWDGSNSYWLEVKGLRIQYEGQLAPLEFGK